MLTKNIFIFEIQTTFKYFLLCLKKTTTTKSSMKTIPPHLLLRSFRRAVMGRFKVSQVA